MLSLFQCSHRHVCNRRTMMKAFFTIPRICSKSCFAVSMKVAVEKISNFCGAPSLSSPCRAQASYADIRERQDLDIVSRRAMAKTRSEENTLELQSLKRNSNAVICSKINKQKN